MLDHEFSFRFAGAVKRPTLKQLSKIIKCIVHVNKMTRLAVELDIEWNKIQKIRRDNKDSYDQCYAMFEEWRQTPQCSWGALIKALKSEAVGEESLAKIISEMST